MFRSPFGIGLLAVLVLIAIITGFNSFSSIEPGNRGVIVTLGKIAGEAEPGVFPKTPFVTNVAVISTRDHVANFPGLTAYTRDQQTASISNVSVTYHVDPARVGEVYLRYGSTEQMVEQLLNRPVSALLEQTFGQYNAETAVQQREKLGIEFSQRVKQNVEDTPLIISTVNIENFDLPDEYEANINARMAAEVEASRAEQTAKKTVIDAKAQADAQIAVATARAEAARLQGEAEAAAIKAKGDALRQNPALVELTKAERWDGVLPQTMLPGGTLPFIDVTPAASQ